MQVWLHNFGRSSHNIGKVFKTDQAAGTIVPCFVDVATDGTDYYIDMQSKIRTLPTNGPIFGTFKHQIDVFSIPLRLYNSVLHNNALGIGLKMATVRFPRYKMIVDVTKKTETNRDQIAQDSLLAYLGVRGLGSNYGNSKQYRTFFGDPLLAYWDIYKNYYANKQEEIGYVVGNINQYEINKSAPGSIKGLTGPAGVSSSVFKWIQTVESGQSGNSYIFTEGVTIQNRDGENARVGIAWHNLGIETPQPGNFYLQLYKGKLIRLQDVFAQHYQDGGNYWFDQLENSGNAIIVTPGSELKYMGAAKKELTLQKFELSNIDDERENILSAKKNVTHMIPETLLPYSASIAETTQTVNGETKSVTGSWFSQAGLGVRTYLSDRFNNWLSTEWVDGKNGINEITAVQVVDGAIQMDALILKKKIYNMMNRIAVSGGSFEDWREAVYGEVITRRPESPVYEGGMSSIITFDEVVSTAAAETSEENAPLGSLAGRGADHGHKGGQSIHVHIEEPSLLIILESIVPHITYSQGNKWFNELQTMDDLHKPSLDAIGFQELPTEECAAWDTQVTGPDQTKKFSLGKQPSWIQYMTNVDEAYGDFSTGEPLEWMTLNRAYEKDEVTGRIKDATTYVDPTKFNIAFADHKLSAKNFWVQIKLDVTARRKMSAKQMPNL